MKFLSARVVLFVLISSLTFISPPKLLASKDKDGDREVYLAFVQGDVRISSGKDHRPDLNQPWERALAGGVIQQGYALATGDGRAEIEFENGSTVYLAENSLLLFRELSAPGDRTVSRISLAAGTGTFFLQSTADASYFIETPTDHLSITDPESFFARVDAFLDATSITPQGNQGETLKRRGLQDLKFAKGQTLLLRGGEVVRLVGQPEGSGAESASPDDARMSPVDSWELVLRGLPDFHLPSMTPLLNQSQMHRSLANRESTRVSGWDAWVGERQADRNVVTAAALRASGLSSPIPRLADLYEHGTFFSCEPYGTCWEAADRAEPQDSTPQSAAPISQSPTQGQGNPPVQPQTVQWEELVQGWCSPPTLRTVTRVAHTPEELRKLEQRKAAAQKARYSPPMYSSACENGYWIPHLRHYARVVTPQLPRHCVGARCKPIHAPRPVWVRAGNKIGFVPAHPNDVKGKPPINLKQGILVPSSEPGERTARVSVEPSEKVSVLDKAPHEFRGEPFNQALRVPAPEIHAHLAQEAETERSVLLSAYAAPQITYDYKSHHFLMPAFSGAGTKPDSRGVPIGGIDSHGKVGSFADGHSGVYAQSFARSEAAESYRGGSFGSGDSHGGYSSGYSGGGHGSGNSSGSYSTGSHSSGSGSSGVSSSHSSSGGGWSSGSSSGSSGGGSSSSSSSSSGGGSRSKP